MKWWFGVEAQLWIAMAALFISVTTYIWSRIREAAIRRAELVKSYTDTFYSSKEVSALFLRIDYEGYVFSESILNTPSEIILIHFLDLLNSIALHYHNRVLRWRDIAGTTLGYAIVRTYQDKEIQKYLTRIDAHGVAHSGVSHSGTGTAFRYFRELGKYLDGKPTRAFHMRSGKLRKSFWRSPTM
jgi:hypothetical protein